jgi:hypothetical protein
MTNQNLDLKDLLIQLTPFDKETLLETGINRYTFSLLDNIRRHQPQIMLRSFPILLSDPLPRTLSLYWARNKK